MCAMDARINHNRTNAEVNAHAAPKKKRAFTFIQDLKEELKKVSWTTQDELKFSTKMVVGTTFFLGMGIYFVDLVIKGCLDLVTLVVHFIFG
ncbi:MAG: preprotein translocase subunit SecE [Verrucomicrobia bacterium]|nr:preprotein translocase subunit SecE [Verrucomicrobiota bacterium]